jgi:hypothetical protein
MKSDIIYEARQDTLKRPLSCRRNCSEQNTLAEIVATRTFNLYLPRTHTSYYGRTALSDPIC